MRPNFNHTSPIPGYQDAPIITAEQMSRFLYSGISSGAAGRIAKEINEAGFAAVGGGEWLQTTYVAPTPPVTHIYGFDIGTTVYSTNKGWGFSTGYGPYIVKREAGNHVGMECGSSFPPGYLTTNETLSAGYVPPKPKRLPIERPVRRKDVRPGDILRYCGAPGQDYFIDNGYLTVGKEYVVGPNISIDYDVATKQGVVRGYWGITGILTGWSFVRRPFKELTKADMVPGNRYRIRKGYQGGGTCFKDGDVGVYTGPSNTDTKGMFFFGADMHFDCNLNRFEHV